MLAVVLVVGLEVGGVVVIVVREGRGGRANHGLGWREPMRSSGVSPHERYGGRLEVGCETSERLVRAARWP